MPDQSKAEYTVIYENKGKRMITWMLMDKADFHSAYEEAVAQQLPDTVLVSIIRTDGDTGAHGDVVRDAMDRIS